MKMSEHLSDMEIEGYIQRTLPPDKLLHLDDHLATCRACRTAMIAAAPVNEAAVLDALDQSDYDAHLSFERLSAYVDDHLDEVEREIANHHLHECGLCYTQLNDLEILKADIAAAPVPVTAAEPALVRFWDRLRERRFPVFAIPAIAVLLVGILFAAWFIANRRGETETAVVTPPISDIPVVSPLTNSESPTQPSVDANVVERPKALVGLNDGKGRIEIDVNGKISGLDDPRFEQTVANALTGKEVEIAPDLRQLRQSSGALMGGWLSGVPFALSGPVGVIVETALPKLRWRPLTGADTYRVEVFDEGFNKVASSPSIRATEWQVNAPLRRGAVYRWQVTATANGEEIKSPARPAPDAKFKVLDAGMARKLDDARAKHGQSHLLLGLLYAEAGLLEDATREFRILVQKNPDSAVARRLLEKVKAAR